MKLRRDLIQKALQHKDLLGEGAKKRRKLRLMPDEKIHAVMAEFKRRTLFSGSGHKVKTRKQAIRIALEEVGKATK